MSEQDLRAQIEALTAANAALKANANKGISMKVSEKGGVSVYGLGRWPITLYESQWLQLLDMGGDIRAFMAEHKAELDAKNAAYKASKAA